MNKKKILITKKFEFSASHRYWRDDWSEQKNNEVFGKCTSPYGHGHNYDLHVTINGDVDPKTGMIINLSELKKYILEILQQFDHKYLNLDTPYFNNSIPTTENFANVLFDLIEKKLTDKGKFYIEKLRLYEKKDLYVDVFRDVNNA